MIIPNGFAYRKTLPRLSSMVIIASWDDSRSHSIMDCFGLLRRFGPCNASQRQPVGDCFFLDRAAKKLYSIVLVVFSVVFCQDESK